VLQIEKYLKGEVPQTVCSTTPTRLNVAFSIRSGSGNRFIPRWRPN